MPPTLASTRLHGAGTAPGTCGELAQGILPGGTRFHVTCPIDRTATVEIELQWAATASISGLGAGSEKIALALRRTAELLELPPARLEVTHRTQLATGKGMASSTADITAAARALAAAAGRPLEPAAIATIAASIESSDGVMFEGICAVEHRTGAVLRRWDWWPQFAIAMAIPRATLDTASVIFDDQDRLAGAYDALLAELDAAVIARSAARFAAVATRSAELNEAFVPNALRPILTAQAAAHGALGVCVGHTGTVAGLLFSGDAVGRQAADRAADALRAALPVAVEVITALTPPSPSGGAAGLRRQAPGVEHRRDGGREIEAGDAVAHRQPEPKIGGGEEVV